MKRRVPSLASAFALAASPVFAAMALACRLQDDGAMPLCGAHPWAANGMVTMYLLMSALHAAPWLKLFARIHVLPAARRS